MTVPALALAPVLIGTGTGASPRTLDEQLLDRTSRPDYHAWLAGTAGCWRMHPAGAAARHASAT